jgi:hypothetical protein
MSVKSSQGKHFSSTTALALCHRKQACPHRVGEISFMSGRRMSHQMDGSNVIAQNSHPASE